MKTCSVCELFDVKYGVNLELNALDIDPQGINFVSRTSKNNGVSARVAPIITVEPIPAGTITVAGGGSVMESFLQLSPYYSGRDLYYLTPKTDMNNAILLYYCHCLRSNKFRFSYGRQSNVSLPELQIPTLDSIPDFVKSFSIRTYAEELLEENKFDIQSVIYPKESELVPLRMLFRVENGIASSQVLREKVKRSENWVPFVRPSYRQETSVDAYVNRQLVPENKLFPTGTLYVSTNGQGSHTYSYVSTTEFVPNSDVSVLVPVRPMSLQEKLYYAHCITKNRYKFSYGRKPKGDRLKAILLPEYPPEYVTAYDINKAVSSFDGVLAQL
jgi:hypothetical protein